MSLDDKNDDEIIISCTGPYILYMDVCYLSMLEGKEVNGTLWLLDERKTPEILFSMSSSHEVCTALHKTVYFRKTGKASLQLISTTNFKIKTVTVGMSSQLGGQCLYWWGPMSAGWRLRPELIGMRKGAQRSCSSAAASTDTLSRTRADGMTSLWGPFPVVVCYLSRGILTVSKKSPHLVCGPRARAHHMIFGGEESRVSFFFFSLILKPL